MTSLRGKQSVQQQHAAYTAAPCQEHHQDMGPASPRTGLPPSWRGILGLGAAKATCAHLGKDGSVRFHQVSQEAACSSSVAVRYSPPQTFLRATENLTARSQRKATRTSYWLQSAMSMTLVSDLPATQLYRAAHPSFTHSDHLCNVEWDVAA